MDGEDWPWRGRRLTKRPLLGRLRRGLSLRNGFEFVDGLDGAESDDGLRHAEEGLAGKGGVGTDAEEVELVEARWIGRRD